MESTPARFNTISYILVFLTVIVTILLYGAVHQPVIAFFYLLVTLLVLLWAGHSYFSGSLSFSTSALQIPLLMLGIYGLIQIIPFGSTVEPGSGLALQRMISIDPFATRMTAVHLLFLNLFFAGALVWIDRETRIQRVATLFIAFGAFYAFFAIIQSILSPERIYGIYEPGSSTPYGSFVNRHNFAAIIEMTIALALGRIFTGNVEKDKRLMYWLAVALMATSLLLSGSRGGLVSLVAGSVFLVLLTVRGKKGAAKWLSPVLAAAILAIALAGAAFVGGETSLSRFADTPNDTNVSYSRTQIWAVTVKVIAEHFPFGAGVGAFPRAYAQQDPSGGSQSVDQAHNDYLQILADAGIVGGIIGAVFLFLFFREGIRAAKNSGPALISVAVGAFTGCFMILVHSLFDFVLHITAISLMFLTLLALLVASGRNLQQETVGRKTKMHSAAVGSITKLDWNKNRN